ncbi:NAD(P)-binding protein [Lepidopterella palustris CBS 459.81]|uniref:NAD(P)-binding protein n=1 Tax=Lepidopterella palustris CBS 459.81 TaxID=1314670 RepID=A0A8E2E148_9PEZI|nr:NAD(P)-binding protein [Lepidopterella palustris CBS 459.81]
MVRVVVAGGTGGVAREVIDGILATKKHEVVVLTRRDIKAAAPSIEFVKVNYSDKAALVEALRGAGVVLSFIVVHQDVGNVAQKNLIDAAVEAGVRRFAPSEWATKSNSGYARYAGKDEVRKYLEEINKDKNVLEYTLFQPGIFLDYLAHPYARTSHLPTMSMSVSYQHRRAIYIGDGCQPVVFTAVRDVAAIVAAALDHPSPWPASGGIQGMRTSFAELVALGEALRGPFVVESLPEAHVEEGVLKASWIPLIEHPSVPEEQRKAASSAFLGGFLKAIDRGVWDVGDEWNKLLPDFNFTAGEEYLRKTWEKKP